MAEVEWSRLRAPELRALASQNAVVIVPIGSTEQHGPHLPTQVDCLLVGEVARRAARRAYATVPTLITPTRVCIPLNSQRTSSQRTQLCRSGRIGSVSIENQISPRASKAKSAMLRMIR